MTYISSVVQDWFEVVLQQKDLSYTQLWLSTQQLFVNELQVHFRLLDLVEDTANLIDNLCMKPGDKITTYNVEFMQYAVQLNWGDLVLCYCFYQGLPNCLQDLQQTRNRANPLPSMPCTNWQSPSTIATGNRITNEIVSGTWRRRQQTATTKDRGKWLSTPLPHKALLCLVPSHP